MVQEKARSGSFHFVTQVVGSFLYGYGLLRKDQERSALRSSSRSEGAKENNEIVALSAKGECD
jgi:hypothetical protein